MSARAVPETREPAWKEALGAIPAAALPGCSLLLLPKALAVGLGRFGSEQAGAGVSLLALLVVVFALGSPFLGSLFGRPSVR